MTDNDDDAKARATAHGDMVRAGLCRGFVIGAMDTLTLTRNICPPDAQLDGGQVIDIVKLWLREHPETRHLGAAILVSAALKEKFPCN